MMTTDEIVGRLRFLESEVNGEKPLARYAIEQARLNGDALGTLTTQVRGVRTEMTIANAALQSHGTLLNILRQDVGVLRADVTVLRRGQEEIQARLGVLEARVDKVSADIEARMDKVSADIEARMDKVSAGIEARIDQTTANMTGMKAEVGGMKAEMAAMNGKLDAILASVAPRGGPA